MLVPPEIPQLGWTIMYLPYDESITNWIFYLVFLPSCGLSGGLEPRVWRLKVEV